MTPALLRSKIASPINPSETAAVLLSPGQILFIALLVGLALAEARVFGPHSLLMTLCAIVTAFYLVFFVGLKLLPWLAATRFDPKSISEIPDVNDQTLPTIDILVAIKGEGEVVNRLVRALRSLVYPVEKLRIFLLLEEDDHATISAVGFLKLREPFKIQLVPDIDGLPQTKPRALTWGFSALGYGWPFLGELVAVYDAEDAPEPLQLLKAVARFRAAEARGDNVGCLQARLTYWNPRLSWISTFYWAEYAVHFRWVLAGLARLGQILPLGGTSNVFLGAGLEAVAEANGIWGYAERWGVMIPVYGPWDPRNVTEDADLAARLSKAGYSIEMLDDSVTYEEAPASVRKALRQRSRWVKGYIQTFLVHTRTPLRSMRSMGPLRYLTFNLFMVGAPLSFLLNPIVWGTTILYVASRVTHVTVASTFIEGLFPLPVYYAGMLMCVAGNLLLQFQHMVAVLHQQEEAESLPAEGRHQLAVAQQGDQYGLSARLLVIPFWWALMAIPAFQALLELARPSRRSYWAKTLHGTDLDRENKIYEGVA